MSLALFRTTLKLQSKNMLSYGIGMTFYLWLIIWIYPSIANSPAINTLLKSMPRGLLQVIGYKTDITQVSDYLAGEFYGVIYIIILAIYTIVTATRLMSHLVENGSMAYLLATPVSRVKVAVTQSLVLATGILVIGLFSTVGGLIGVRWFIHANINGAYFIEMNIVGALMFFVIGSYSFLFSCLIPEERTALGFSAGLTLIFYALHTAAAVSDKFSWLQHLSIFTAFNAQNLVHGTAHFTVVCFSLIGATVGLFLVAYAGFRRKELSL